jgi:SAM-dependent methyltransferase
MGREHQALQLLANYWEKRSGHYDSPQPDVFGRNITASYLRKLKPKSLVEVGCGTGQLFPLYKDIPHVVGCDWTDGMLMQAHKRLDRHEISNIKLKKLDITKEALNEHFDVALTRTVLMHIPEEAVEDACGNLCKMADTVLLFEFYDPNAPGLEWHCFHHEYPVFMRKFGFEISEAFDRPDGMKQMLMIFKKENKEKKQNGPS